jgi:diguanylate cyclase (GGDEF)-like protein
MEAQERPGMDTAETAFEDRELRLLLVEDSEADAELAIRYLHAAGFRYSYERVVDEAQMRRALRTSLPDLIIADFSLPGFGGISALAIARAEAPDVPFIFLSGTIGEERAIEALKSGATDYVLKANSKRLVPAVKRALADAELRRASQLAERQVARLTGVLQMLSGINAAVVRIPNRDQLLHETCRLAHRVGGYAVAMVALIDPTTRMARPVGWAGYDFLARPDLQFPVADHEVADTSLMGRVIRTGQAALCEDIHQPTFVIEGREQLIAAGVRSLACLPLRVDGTPVGSFLCGTGTSGVIGAEELLLLEEVASNLSFALQYLDKQDAVRFLSYFEPLTGLAKRALFCERLSRELKQEAAAGLRLAVAVFDIEHLSVINDSFGRQTGDRLLQCVADRLKRHCPDTEHLAHLGGGTFVRMRRLSAHTEEELRHLHDDLTSALDQPFSVDGHEMLAKMRTGVAFYPEDGSEPDVLVQNAEAALKGAKGSGEQYLRHRIEMNSDLARRVGMEQRLRAALDQGQFVLYYQPKVTLRTGKIDGVEALLRWHDPENGLVAPGHFLPLLESAGLMPATSAWVVKQAASDCRQWRRMGLPPTRIAINISPPELRRRNNARDILDSIGDDLLGDPNWGIDIEVTEGALVGDSSGCIDALRLLRGAGLRIAIDDFGTGFSSLGRLSELPIDTLKIDRSFTMRLPDDPKGRTLVSTIIELAHAFDMTTVAEGVETQIQLDYLLHQACDVSQGYLHGRPMPRHEFERLSGLTPLGPDTHLVPDKRVLRRSS